MFNKQQELIDQNIINYLGISEIENNGDGLNFVFKGIKYQTLGKRLDWILYEIGDKRQLITLEEFIVCNELTNTESCGFNSDVLKRVDACCLHELLLKLLPKETVVLLFNLIAEWQENQDNFDSLAQFLCDCKKELRRIILSDYFLDNFFDCKIFLELQSN